MADPVSLATLRTRCRQRVDMENSPYASDSELNGLINESCKALYDELVQKFEDDYFTTEYTFSGVTGQEDYAFPVDFYKMVGLDVAFSPTGKRFTVPRFNFAERNSLRNAGAGTDNEYQYRPMGTSIKILPAPKSSDTFYLWYIPVFPELTVDSDEIDGVNGFTELVVLDVGIKLRTKEQVPVNELVDAKNQVLARIMSMAGNRDAGEPEVATDLRYKRDEEWFRWRRV